MVFIHSPVVEREALCADGSVKQAGGDIQWQGKISLIDNMAKTKVGELWYLHCLLRLYWPP